MTTVSPSCSIEEWKKVIGKMLHLKPGSFELLMRNSKVELKNTLRSNGITPETIIYSTVQVVTGPNNNAWVYLDFDTGSSSSSSVKFEISRDNGTTWTELVHNTVTSIASQPAGVQVIYRVTLTGQLLLHNLAWGLK